MRETRHVPLVRLPQTGRSHGRGVALSILIHVVVIGFIIYEKAPEWAETRSAGGAGPRGGGGGGGATYVHISMPAYQAPQARAEQQVSTPAPMIIPTPEVQEIKLEEFKMEMPQTVSTGQVSGIGGGEGGGRGQGPGSGGGTGTGEGTGTGSARGPGTGGDGGEIFPPTPRETTIPFDAPPGIKGKTFRVVFWVDEKGQVTRIEEHPTIRDPAASRWFLARMQQWRFNPASTRDGLAVSAPVNIGVSF